MINFSITHFFENVFFLFADLSGYIYILLKIFRVFCYTKITFDQLPFFSPYYWPLSAIRILTVPYFRFWSKFLPSLKFGKYSYDISVIIALEFLSSLLLLISKLRTILLIQAEFLINN
jgi:hypothetical protein